MVGEFARGSVRINDEGVSLGGVDRVVDGIGCSLTVLGLNASGDLEIKNLLMKNCQEPTENHGGEEFTLSRGRAGPAWPEGRARVLVIWPGPHGVKGQSI